MKKMFFGLAAAVGCSLLWGNDASAADMYRLYNPNNGEHFYTASFSERDQLFSAGWNYEDVAWDAPASGNPVFRLYNRNSGDHHYTMDVGERDGLVAVGWQYESIGWNSDSRQRVPIYRAYNPNAATGSHHYTTDKSEINYLVSLGWEDEDIGWYAVSTAQQTETTPASLRGNYQGKNQYDGSTIRVAISANELIFNNTSYPIENYSLTNNQYQFNWDVEAFKQKYPNANVPGPQPFFMTPENNRYIFNYTTVLYKK